MKEHHNLFPIKIIVVTLIYFILYGSVSAVEKDSLLNPGIQQSILNRYQQILIESYDFYYEKLGFKETKTASKTRSSIQNFPILVEDNLELVSQQIFHTELFFSNIHSIRDVINNETKSLARIVVPNTKEKIIKISNIPVNQGFLSSRFGMRKDPIHGNHRMHKGIDIAAKYGSEVYPLGKGEVIFSGYKSGYGNTVEIKHGNTVVTRYAHLKRFLVDAGQQVSIGDNIGLIGRSGRSTGPHLHLEVLFNGNQVDPQIFLANHFGSRTNSYQLAKAKPVSKAKKKKILNKKINTEYPQISAVSQISYQDYVDSVDGMFGFSAPISSAR